MTQPPQIVGGIDVSGLTAKQRLRLGIWARFQLVFMEAGLDYETPDDLCRGMRWPLVIGPP